MKAKSVNESMNESYVINMDSDTMPYGKHKGIPYKDLDPEQEDRLGIEYHAVQILVSEDPREDVNLSGLLMHFILEARSNKFFPTFAKAAKCLSLDTATIRTIKTVNLTKARKNVASKLK